MRLSHLILLCFIFFSFTALRAGEVFTLTSPEFKDGGFIPPRFSCHGEDVSPRLEIQGVPEGAKSLALFVEDPDAPMGTWDHWIVYNISPKTRIIEEGTNPGTLAFNSFQKLAWGGPCPPGGTHHYIFTLYALDKRLEIRPDARKTDVKVAMTGHIIAQTKIVGLYKNF